MQRDQFVAGSFQGAYLRISRTEAREEISDLFIASPLPRHVPPQFVPLVPQESRLALYRILDPAGSGFQRKPLLPRQPDQVPIEVPARVFRQAGPCAQSVDRLPCPYHFIDQLTVTARLLCFAHARILRFHYRRIERPGWYNPRVSKQSSAKNGYSIHWADKRRCRSPKRKNGFPAPCRALALNGSKYCTAHHDLDEGEKVAQAALAATPPFTLQQRYEQARNDPGLYDMGNPLAWLQAYKQILVERSEKADTPDVRSHALAQLKLGHPDKAQEILQKGVEADALLKKIADLAERQIVSQARAAEIALRQEVSMTPQQVMLLLQGVIQIVANICGAHQAQRVVAETYKGLLNRQPKLALTGIMISGENGNGE